MSFRQCASALVAALLFLPAASIAQDLTDEPTPAHVAVVDGAATLTREGERDGLDGGMPLVPGDVIRTDRGRLEVVLADGSVLDLDEYSSLELLSPSLYRLGEGRLRLTIVGVNNPSDAARYAVDTPLASAEMIGPGEYRLSLAGTASGLQASLDVIRGTARFSTERGSTPLRAGQTSVAYEAAAPTYPRFFNSARLDPFDQWAASLRADRVTSRSAQYLPTDLRAYSGDLDRSGSWSYESDYGYVWYPTVAADWRPYADGYWAPVPSYGWTWIGVGVWSWPTHHYGRWGSHGSRWFWIPDHHFAPAWVSWGTAPGYVSWCPLGYNNRPVASWSVSVGGYWGGGAWTVVARDHFGGPRWNAHQYAVRTLPGNTAFVQHASAPLPAGRDPGRRGVSGGRNDTAASAGFAVPRAGIRTAPGSLSSGGRATAGGTGLGDRSARTGAAGSVDSPRAASREVNGRADIRGDRSESRSGSYAVPRTVPRDNTPGATSTPVQSSPEQRARRAGRQANDATSASPPPAAPATSSRQARPRDGTSAPAAPPSSFEPRRPIEPVNPGARSRGRDAQPPSSFEPARPIAPATPQAAPQRQERSYRRDVPAPPSSPRAEPRSAPRGDRPARDQGASQGSVRQAPNNNGGNEGGGRAHARQR